MENITDKALEDGLQLREFQRLAGDLTNAYYTNLLRLHMLGLDTTSTTVQNDCLKQVSKTFNSITKIFSDSQDQ